MVVFRLGYLVQGCSTKQIYFKIIEYYLVIMKFPQYDSSFKKGEDGITIVKSIVENELNWIFRKNHQEYDFGIDAYIDVISEFAQITGKTIALQIKTGQSYFSEKGAIGWIYRGEMKHLNYYLNHDIPVIIIIVDDINKKAYWNICDAEKTEKAGSNWKITIPYNNELNSASKKELHIYISPQIDYASQLEHFWLVNQILKEKDRIVFIVERPEVEKCLSNYLLDAFKRLEVNPELLVAVKGKVDVWIHGYDNDSRELYEIEEVRKWIQVVFDEILGWAYFLTLDDNAEFMRVIQLCYMNYKILKKGIITKNKIKKTQFRIDLTSGEFFLYALYDNLNSFCEKHSIPDEINIELSDRVMEYLTGIRRLN